MDLELSSSSNLECSFETADVLLTNQSPITRLDNSSSAMQTEDEAGGSPVVPVADIPSVNHMEALGSSGFECHVCNVKIKDRSNFTRHMRSKHPDASSSHVYVHCKFCHAKFTSRGLKVHVKCCKHRLSAPSDAATDLLISREDTQSLLVPIDPVVSLSRVGIRAKFKKYDAVVQPLIEHYTSGELNWLPGSSFKRLNVKGQKETRGDVKYLIRIAEMIQPEQQVELKVFTDIQICQKVSEALAQKSPSRLYALWLAVKKIVLYIEYIMQTASSTPCFRPRSASWKYVDDQCNHCSVMKKQGIENRLMGVHDIAGDCDMVDECNAVLALRAQKELEGDSESEDELTKEQINSITSQITKQELQTLASGVKTYLDETCSQAIKNHSKDPSMAYNKAKALQFTKELFTLTLLLIPSPRQQVFAQLRYGVSFIVRSQCILLQLKAEQNKSKKAMNTPLPKLLSRYYVHYWAFVRPWLVDGQFSSKIVEQTRFTDFVFLNLGGTGPQKNFSKWTKSVTNKYISKQLSAHSFRHLCATLLWSQGGLDERAKQDLAILMSHDLSVAKKHYYRPELLSRSAAFSKILREVLIKD